MKRVFARRHPVPPASGGLTRVLPQIQSLIEASRQHVVSTANLTLVWLYWNVGRVVTEDIQGNQKRADYGQRMIEQLAANLTREYGRGFSAPNLWDMKRFFEGFEILQTVSRELAGARILPSVLVEPCAPQVRPTSSGQGAKAQIGALREIVIGFRAKVELVREIVRLFRAGQIGKSQLFFEGGHPSLYEVQAHAADDKYLLDYFEIVRPSLGVA